MSERHPHHEDHPNMISRAARRGLKLFFIYFALYAGFLLLNVFSPAAMANPNIILYGREFDLYGLNIALIYGLGLILAAIILAFYYMCTIRTPDRP